jgi:polyhydroxybutyrate depolymerase
MAAAASAAAILLFATGCGPYPTRDGTPTEPATAPVGTSPAPSSWAPESSPCATAGSHRDGCTVPGYAARPFDVFVPSSYTTLSSLPVVVFLHGGGGNGEQTQATTCAGGDLASPTCLQAIGQREGFITVFPNGTGTRLLKNVRTWNAGGGGPNFACASGYACEANIDDIAYLGAVLDEVEAEYRVDASRIYFSGFSDGAAMVHRVGCEMAGRVAAIAPVSGENEFATSADCSPARPMPVLDIHGTADPCWTYESSTTACADQDPRPKIGAFESTAGWVARDRCVGEGTLSPMPDTASDGMTSDVRAWPNCAGGAEVRLITVHGGGHVFPGGAITSPRSRTDAGTQDFGAQVLWDFLSRFRLG